MAYGFLAALVGFFSAGIGIGGGTILVSTLVSIGHFTYRRAAATSLAVIMPITLAGAVSHTFLHPGTITLDHFPAFLVSGILGSTAGYFLVGKFNNQWVKLIFAGFILLVGLKMLGLSNAAVVVFSLFHENAALNMNILVILFGLLTGLVSITLGVGCGLLIVPFFVLVLRFDIHTAILLSLFTMFLLALTGSLVHRRLNALDSKTVRIMLLPALLGAVAGVVVSSHLPAALLNQVFGAFLVLVGLVYWGNAGRAWFLAKRKGMNFVKEC